MTNIGRKIYYELATGNVIVDTGERSGSVVATTIEQDFAAYAALAERVPETVGMIELDYGEYAQDFAECNGVRVNISGAEPALEFSYPTGGPGEPVYRPPLSEEVAQLQAEKAALEVRVTVTEEVASATSADLQALMEYIAGGM